MWRIINAQARHLPTYDVEVVDSLLAADAVAIHAGALVETNKPIITHNHGLYWTGDFAWANEYWRYNAAVIEALRRAHAVTVPSEWVAYPIKRDMRIVPIVIPHGIDIENFEPAVRREGELVLWAKPRVDIVSTPEPMNELAQIVPNINFVTTFGRAAHNVSVVGAMPHNTFRQMMQRCTVWLATTRETGDIASREAMAMAIPVLAWDWGGTAELVIHEETGYLAKVGDYEDLKAGLYYCLENRDRLGAAGREHVKQYQWKDIMGQYAQIYHDVVAADEYPVKVSVVVPTYNYADFLPNCLRSLKEQTFNDFEVVVVNDGSTDNTLEVLDNLESELGVALRVINQDNQGLPAALNTGHKEALGKYIINLDPDNELESHALETLSESLDENPWLDVASGGLGMIQKDGSHYQATDWPFGTIDVRQQLRHINQLASSSMIRARTFKRLGGYRVRCSRNEDGEFWCRAMSAGLRFRQVTTKPCLLYR